MSYHHFINFSVKLLILAAVITVFVVLFNKWLKFKERSWAFLLKQDNNKVLASLRVTAYERLTIMLERISPQALVMRLSTGSSTAGRLQMEILKAIREEFDHNISLQIYVSPECWEKVVTARDQVSELIKVAFTKVHPESSAMELSRAILLLEGEVGNRGIKDALASIRMEMARYF